MAHNFNLCSKSDIVILCVLTHKEIMTDSARTPQQLGTAVQRARKRLGWNQTQLGEQAGLRQETISLIETGNGAAKLETILAVCAALDLELRIAPRKKGSATELEDIF